MSNAGFVRSVITRVLAIFIVVSIVIASIAFFSFTAEIRSFALADRQRQLASVEKMISGKMEEITSIAYHIGNDPVFYLEPVEHDPTSGMEMSKILKRYLVGNSFIEHLAFCRMAEPDTIYTSNGERSLSEFFVSSFGMDMETAAKTVQSIQSATETRVAVTGTGEDAYFAYGYPLPQLSVKPRAQILMMIPVKNVRPLFDSLLSSLNGEAVVFDAGGQEIYRIGNVDDELPLADYAKKGGAEQTCKSASGQKYVLQKVVSDSNGWTYVSVIRRADTLSGLANKQLAFLVTMLLLLAVMTVVMLLSIIAQYKPISKLAAQVSGQNAASDNRREPLDERTLLSNAITALKDDSEQKQKYESAYYEAEAASQAKSAFLSSMSHDIRTPMNAIVGMTALALQHRDEPVYVEDCLKKVQAASDYLLDIINNVLDMSRIEAGRIPIVEEPVLIPALIDSVVSLMASSIDSKAQTLNVDMSQIQNAAVLGDSVHLVQVFVNIVSNAVKFTPEGGRLTLSVREAACGEPSYSLYVFTFSDTGIGIPPAFVDQVFDTFSRADGLDSAKTEGTGLGMAIAKNLIELMGGNIRCESELGRGTTFTVTLHMRRIDADKAAALMSVHGKARATQAEGEEPVVHLNGRRILLVEDNAMNREIARRILGETGAEIIEAQNGQEAVEFFSSHPAGYFDLIFMDVQMPVMNGYDATAAIRSMDRPDAASIPIYAMTANTFDEDVRRVKAAGMNGHIGKPYNPSTVYRVLARLLG